MIKQCLTLLKVQLSGQFRLRDRKRSQIAILAVLVLLGWMVCAYSFILAFGLGIIGIAWAIPSCGVTISSLIILFFTTVKSNGILFAYKDYDILMALPVKTRTVITSRFLTMYVWDLIFTALIMVPMGVAYVIFDSPGILFYLIWLTGIFAVPLIPMTIAAMLGAFIIFISSRFRYANIVNTIISFGMVIVILALSFGVSGFEINLNAEMMQSIGDIILKQMHNIYPPAAIFYKAAVGQNILFFFLYLVVSAGWYYLFARVLEVYYKRMNTGLMAHHARSNFKLKKLKLSNPLTALWKKELKRFFTCTIYVTNMGMGIVMALMLTAVCCFMGKDKLEMILQIPGMTSVLTRIFPFMIAALISMTCTPSVSLSLEGRNLWILKSLPVDAITIYKSKILMDLTLKIPAGLLCSLMAVIGIPMESPGMAIMFFVIPIVYSTANSIFGMYANLKLPNYEWTSETTVVKQSLSAMMGMFGGMLNGLIPILVLVILPFVDAVLIMIVLACIEAAGAWLLYRHLKTMKF